MNTSGVLGTLLERRLIKITGRKAVVGRPFLYATTREFLDRFGLKNLADLPKVEDMAEALGLDVPEGLAASPPIDEVLPFDSSPSNSKNSKEQVHLFDWDSILCAPSKDSVSGRYRVASWRRDDDCSR